MNLVDNTLFRYYTNNTQSRITTTNHPLPVPITSQITSHFQTQAGSGGLLSIVLMVGYSFLTASFVHLLIKEKCSNAKHLQYVNGAKAVTYWSSTYLWDVVQYLLITVAVIVVFIAFDKPAFSGIRLGYVFLLITMYGLAQIPTCYIMSFVFSSPANGFVWTMVIHFMLGMVLHMIVKPTLSAYLMSQTGKDSIDFALSIIPNYCLSEGIGNILDNYRQQLVCEQRALSAQICKLSEESNAIITYRENYLSWHLPGIGRYLIYLAIHTMVFWAVIIITESGLLRRICSACFGVNRSQLKKLVQSSVGPEDEDVGAERHVVQSTPVTQLRTTNMLVVKDITKLYDSKVAVDRLCFTVNKGYCFGLLGVNGAGKTSTFKMLTGEIPSDHGDAYVNSHSVSESLSKVHQSIGYCPQFDALLDTLTGEEMLYLFGRLRGVPAGPLRRLVRAYLRQMLLTEHAHKLTQHYSGGNKRKLSVALSLLGGAPVVFLDEPSTGMDPGARHHLWSIIKAVNECGRSVVLTSHSMEECEALCHQITIMVNGQIKCLGTTQRLKSKFGEGYTVMLKLPVVSTEESSGLYERVRSHVESNLSGAVLKDQQYGLLHYHILDGNASWPRLFTFLEGTKTYFGLADYSVSQTSLEQVFLSFARMQDETTD